MLNKKKQTALKRKLNKLKKKLHVNKTFLYLKMLNNSFRRLKYTTK